MSCGLILAHRCSSREQQTFGTPRHVPCVAHHGCRFAGTSVNVRSHAGQVQDLWACPALCLRRPRQGSRTPLPRDRIRGRPQPRGQVGNSESPAALQVAGLPAREVSPQRPYRGWNSLYARAARRYLIFPGFLLPGTRSFVIVGRARVKVPARECFPVMRGRLVRPCPGVDRRTLIFLPVAVRERAGGPAVQAGDSSLRHGAQYPPGAGSRRSRWEGFANRSAPEGDAGDSPRGSGSPATCSSVLRSPWP
jgi:hypothetical protein